jgi:AcrR family transcriptional regulator
LAAADVALAQRGFDATSLDEIAAAAGLTKGAIYSSFGSKDALFAELITVKIGDRMRKVAAAIDTSVDRSGLARRVGRTLTDASLGDPAWQIAFIEFWSRAMRNTELRVMFAAHRQAALAAMADYIQQQATALDIVLPLSPIKLATTMLALSNGLAIEGLLRPEAADPDLLGDVLELLFEHSARTAHDAGQAPT